MQQQNHSLYSILYTISSINIQDSGIFGGAKLVA